MDPHPMLEIVQEAARSSSLQPPVPFSVLQLGKALFTLPLLTLVTIGVVARAVRRLRARTPDQLAGARSAIDLCLFWGFFTFGAATFHMAMSLISTSWSVQLYAPIEAGDLWLAARGVMLALISGAYGLLVLLLTALAWLGLRRRHARIHPAAA